MKKCTTVARPFLISLLSLAAACSGGGGDGSAGTPPGFLGYTQDLVAYRSGIFFVSNAPVVTGAVTSWSIAPALPAGLALDAGTGVISGTPTAPTLPTVYQVDATNAYGTTTRPLHMLVTEGEDAFVVAVNALSDAASAYALQGDVLTHNGYLPVGSNPQDAVAAPFENAVVVPNADSNDVSVVLVDESSGRLTAAAGSPFASGTQPTDAAVSGAGDFAWVLAAANGTGGAIHQYALDGATGVLTALAPASVAAGDDLIDLVAAIDGGQVYALAGGPTGELRAFDVAGDGTLSSAATTAAGVNPTAAALHPWGALLYVANGNGTLSGFARDTSTGVLTELASSPYAGTLGSYAHVALSLDGNHLFAVSVTGEVDSFVVDFDATATGVAGALHTPAAIAIGSGPGTQHVTLGGDGDRLVVTNPTASRVSLMDVASDGTLSSTLPPHSVAQTGPTASCVIGRATAPSFVADTLYATNRGTDDISQFSRSGAGTLTAIAPPNVSTGSTPSFVEVHPHLDVLYVVNQAETSKAIEVFSLAADGSATWIQDVAQTNNGLWNIAVDPSGRFAYSAHLADSELYAYSIGSDGSLTSVGTPLATGATPRDVAVHPAGGFVYVADSLADTISMYSIDPSTGAPAPLSPASVASGIAPFALTIDPTGEFLYCANNGVTDSVSMYAIDAATGQLSQLSASPFALTPGTNPRSLAADPGGRILWAVMRGDSTLRGLLINRNAGNTVEDGALVQIATENLVDLPFMVRTAPDGSTVYVSIEVTSGVIESYTTLFSSGSLLPLETTASGPLTSGIALRNRIQ